MTHRLVVDTSALMAFLLQEPEAEALLNRETRTESLLLCAAIRLELTRVAEGSRFNNTSTALEALLNHLRVQRVPINTDQMRWTLNGWRHYCKGLAKAMDAPLVFKGEVSLYKDAKAAD